MLGTVTDDTVRVRAEKSTDSDILELVAKDTVLPVEEQDKDWVQVTLANDVTGYIAADYITVAESYEYAMTIDDYTAMVDAETQKTNCYRSTNNRGNNHRSTFCRSFPV